MIRSILKKIRTVSLIVVFVLSLVLTGFAFFGPFSKISSVELNTDDSLKTSLSYTEKKKEILSYLEAYKGKLLWRLSLEDMVYKMHSIYSGVDVYIHRRFPNRLIVSLKKKDTAFLLLKGEKTFYSVSYDGEIGTQRNMEESLDFPVLRGQGFWKSPLLRKRALSMLSAVPIAEQNFSIQNISEISYNKSRGSLFLYLITGSFILELKEPPSPEKVRQIEFVINYLKQKELRGSLIDARLNKKIIVKNRN